MIVTLAPAITAPLASVTLPTMRPVAIWAETLEIEAMNVRVQTNRATAIAGLGKSLSVFAQKHRAACESSLNVDASKTISLAITRLPLHLTKIIRSVFV